MKNQSSSSLYSPMVAIPLVLGFSLHWNLLQIPINTWLSLAYPTIVQMRRTTWNPHCNRPYRHQDDSKCCLFLAWSHRSHFHSPMSASTLSWNTCDHSGKGIGALKDRRNLKFPHPITSLAWTRIVCLPILTILGVGLARVSRVYIAGDALSCRTARVCYL